MNLYKFVRTLIMESNKVSEEMVLSWDYVDSIAKAAAGKNWGVFSSAAEEFEGKVAPVFEELRKNEEM